MEQPIEQWTDDQLKAKAEELKTSIERMAEQRASILKELQKRGKTVEAEERAEAYEDFKNKVKDVLQSAPEGLAWVDIKSRAGFKQKVPNNKWVRKMETDIGLIREHDKKLGLVWRLK